MARELRALPHQKPCMSNFWLLSLVSQSKIQNGEYAPVEPLLPRQRPAAAFLNTNAPVAVSGVTVQAWLLAPLQGLSTTCVHAAVPPPLRSKHLPVDFCTI